MAKNKSKNRGKSNTTESRRRAAERRAYLKSKAENKEFLENDFAREVCSMTDFVQGLYNSQDLHNWVGVCANTVRLTKQSAPAPNGTERATTYSEFGGIELYGQGVISRADQLSWDSRQTLGEIIGYIAHMFESGRDLNFVAEEFVYACQIGFNGLDIEPAVIRECVAFIALADSWAMLDTKVIVFN